jgi:subtilisin family serine protease
MPMRLRRPFVSFATCLALALVAIPATTAYASSDPYSSTQWGLRLVRAEAAWSKGTGKGVTVAVVDSGVDVDHEDLRRNVVPGYDFVDHDSDPRDENGHGTHVAGIIAAVANNGRGVAGVAPDAKIMPVRVLDADGAGALSDIEAGVRWAVTHGAKVVNLSLSSGVIVEFLTGGTLTDVVDYAWSKGVIAVVSAGNEGLFRSELRRAKAIVVTATTPQDTKASYATGVGFAPWGMAAPGGTDEGGERNMILSTWWDAQGRRYAYLMGTSMAAPHVAGAAAVLRGMGLSPQETVDALLSTAKDLGAPGRDSAFGAGRLDLAAAALGQAGGTGRPGAPGSSAEGSSATGAPGESSNGTRGAPGSVPARRSVVATPTAAATVEPIQDAKPVPRAETGGGGGRGFAFMLAGIGVAAAGSAALLLSLWRRRALA